MIPRYRPELPFAQLIRIARSPRGDFRDLERAVARRYGYEHALWFPYGRVAVEAYLRAVGSSGKRVVLSDFNCIALGAAIAAAEHTPFVVDVEPDGFNQHLGQFARALSAEESACGILVSQWGIPPDPHALAAIGKPLLHDLALRSLDPSRPELRPGDAALYSFGWGKPVPSQRGAVLCLDDKSLADELAKWRDDCLVSGARGKDLTHALLLRAAHAPGLHRAALFFGDTRFARRTRGFSGPGNLHPSDWNRIPCRAVFQQTIESIERLDALRENRRQQIERYHAGLAGLKGLLTLPPPVETLSHFPVRTLFRGPLAAHLGRAGIATSARLFDRLIGDHAWLNGTSAERTLSARLLAGTTLHLPLFHGLAPDEQARVIRQVHHWRERLEARHATQLSRARVHLSS